MKVSILDFEAFFLEEEQLLIKEENIFKKYGLP